MAEDKKLTIYQRLSRLFSDQAQGIPQPTPSYEEPKQILKTDNREEYEQQMLQLQQAKYLDSQWKKVDSTLYQQSLYYSSVRLSSYYDFNSMEYTPEISAALDIYSEESTMPSEDGQVITVYSESDRIKNVLQDLFTNVLDLETNLQMWTRNTCKYGDNFIYLRIDPKKGIYGCSQLPNIEIERIEEGHVYNNTSTDNNKKKTVKFTWKKNQELTFNTWEMAHFRILGDDIKLPYGTSMLDKARRVWKQLCVSENTKIWTLNGYTEIKNLKKDDIIFSYDYNNKKLIQTKIKDCWNSGVKTTYKVRCKYSNIDVTDDHPILIFNGEKYEYKKVKDINIGKDKMVIPAINNPDSYKKIKLSDVDYYIKLNSNGLEKAKLIDRVGIVKKLKIVNLKDYKNVHRFIQGNGKVKYSYLPKLKELFNISEDDIDLFYNNTKSLLNKKLEFAIDNEFIKFIGFMLGDGWVVKNGIGFALGVYEDQNQYYINYAKRFQKNLRLTTSKHSKFSRTIVIDSKELKNIFIESGFISGFAKKRIPKWIYNMNLTNKRSLIRGLFDADGSDKYGVIGLANKNLITDLKELCLQAGIGCGRLTKKDGSTKFNNKTKKFETRQDSYKLYINFNNIIDNVRFEKVIDITKNNEEPVWDLEVDNDLHNFIGNGIVVHNCLSEDAMMIYRITRAPERRVFKVFVGNMDDKDVEAYVQKVANKFKRDVKIDPQTGQADLRFNSLAVDQDFFIPIRDITQTMPIETLPGGCISLDTKIPLLDGRTLMLSEIITEWDNGNRNLWVYSCNPETGEKIEAPISWAGITRKNTKVLKIILDNGKEIIATPDHKFVHKDKGSIEAQNLIIGDSLMPYNADTILITNIITIENNMDTGTITVDGDEIYCNYHTFAVDAGFYIFNSNMGEIADIEYIQKKLLAALRIPKAFIGFEESVGDGKNLALLDIRFARTINRIQRSMIMELNKIAKIHLFILGFTDELDNFKLALTNPSTQADLLRIESWKEKIQLYRDATTDPGNGILPMSATMAKRKVLGMSDSDIKLDLEQQRMEIAAANELKNTPNVITHTGIFDEVDKIYGIGKAATATPPPTEGSSSPPSPSPSSSMPSPPSSEPNPAAEEGGETGTEGTAAEPLPGGGAEEIVPNESLVNSTLPLLNEQSSITKGQRTLKDIYDKLNDLNIE